MSQGSGWAPSMGMGHPGRTPPMGPPRPPCGGGVGFTVGMGSPRPPCGVAWGLFFVDGVNSIIIITTNSKSLQTNENLENQGTPQ